MAQASILRRPALHTASGFEHPCFGLFLGMVSPTQPTTILDNSERRLLNDNQPIW
jgi:hypothetical protein